MYIRYNNSPNYGRSSPPPRGQHSAASPPMPQQNQSGNNPHHGQHSAPPPQSHHEENPRNGHSKTSKPPPPPPKEEKKGFKNPLKFLPNEIYDPKTHKFFNAVSAEDILLIGLILMVLDSGCDDDLMLALALGYILLSDYLDFGNILF